MSSKNGHASKRASRRWRVGLQSKLVVGLLLLSLVPLAVSSILIGNIGEVAQNFASNHVAQLRPHLETAQSAYRDLIGAKRAYFQELTKRLAQQFDSSPSGAETDEPPVEETDESLNGVDAREFQVHLDQHALLIRLEVVNSIGKRIAYAEKAESKRPEMERYREFEVREEMGHGRTLIAMFAADMAPVENLQSLGEALTISRRVDAVQSSLPSSYRLAFLLLVGGVVVVVTALALLFAGSLTKRIKLLVVGAREVAQGDLEARVELESRDEFGELATAFNNMVSDLQEERKKTLYLQRIGAWQDVARKLAHEIKNPLTPIQLVVQQVVSKYDGDDSKYQKLLGTCDEIVREEIEGLRRLVDAFRDLGRLPKVEATALPLAVIINDIKSDPALSELVQIELPEEELQIVADRLLLRRALVNLLENGIQAGQEAGKPGDVILCCQGLEGIVEFTIDDQGDGVPEAKREQIFDPYVTSKETGTGLGLAIAKKVALDHRGDLRLSPQSAPMGGARFILEIPLVDS